MHPTPRARAVTLTLITPLLVSLVALASAQPASAAPTGSVTTGTTSSGEGYVLAALTARVTVTRVTGGIPATNTYADLWCAPPDATSAPPVVADAPDTAGWLWQSQALPASETSITLTAHCATRWLYLRAATGEAPATGITVNGAAIGGSPTATAPTGGTTFVVMMENTERSSVIGNSAAPYLNGLASANGQATDIYALTHPSLPNRLALTSGSTQGIRDDGYYVLSAPNLFDTIRAAGKDWRQYNEDMPQSCYAADAGTYVVHHNAPLYYASIVNDTALCQSHDLTFATLWGDLAAGTTPALTWIEPNNRHNGHNTDVATQDQYLSTLIPQILASPAYTNGGHLIITWDEGTTGSNGGGKVALIVMQPGQTATTDARTLTMYSFERTLADLVGVTAPGAGARAPSLTGLFTP